MVRFRQCGSVFALVSLAGCSGPRYSVQYDDRVGELKRIAVLPVSVVVQSWHSGGIFEARPDLTDDVRGRMVAAARDVVASRGREAVPLELPPVATSQESEASHGLALLMAVREAIEVHHYPSSNDRAFDYATGDAVARLTRTDADAVLCLFLTGAVPTSGRVVLGTAVLVVGAFRGINLPITTSEAMVGAMLIDCRTGDVLWFNESAADLDVRGTGALRRLVEGTCATVLKPRRGR